MSSGLTPEEQFALRSDFGLRLSNSMKQNGPLCVGIDPHRKVLSEWGYQVNAEGAELYAMRMLQAAPAVKFQSSMFERYGAKGYAALERVLYAARQMDIITIVDCLHGGLSTTISAIADAYFKQGMCFVNLDKKAAAKERLNQLIKKYPKAPQARRAEQIIKEKKL